MAMARISRAIMVSNKQMAMARNFAGHRQ